MASTMASWLGRHPLVLVALALVISSWAAFFALRPAQGAPDSRFRQGSARLSVCVDAAPGLQPALAAVGEAAARLPAQFGSVNALARSKGFPNLFQAEGVRPPEVTLGCPGGFLTPPQGPDAVVKPEPVAVPSPHQVHVFVLGPGSQAADILGSLPYRRVAFEIQCTDEGHVCAEVTTALYVESAVAGDAGLMTAALEEALGLAETRRTLVKVGVE